MFVHFFVAWFYIFCYLLFLLGIACLKQLDLNVYCRHQPRYSRLADWEGIKKVLLPSIGSSSVCLAFRKMVKYINLIGKITQDATELSFNELTLKNLMNNFL